MGRGERTCECMNPHRPEEGVRSFGGGVETFVVGPENQGELEEEEMLLIIEPYFSPSPGHLSSIWKKEGMTRETRAHESTWALNW